MPISPPANLIGPSPPTDGRWKEAIGCGLQATTLRPNDLLAWTALSQMYVQAGQIAFAEDAKGRARILSLGGKIVKEENETEPPETP
jgi:Flp pilus assembly protein TadD